MLGEKGANCLACRGKKRVPLACDQQVLASLGWRAEKEREGWVEGGMNGWG